MPEPAEPPASEQFILRLNAVHGRLLAYLRAMLGNAADAEDVLQRASITLWRKFSDYDPQRDFFAWACSFAFYEAKNFQRFSARSRLHFDDALLERLAEERLRDLDRRDARLDAMDRCVEELDGDARDLVRAFYLDETGVGELAARLGRAPQTLYNKLAALRRLLANCVQRRLTQEV